MKRLITRVKEIDLRRELTDDEVMDVIRRQVKDYKESSEDVIKNGDTNAQEELNTCISSIKNKEVDLKRKLTEDEVMDIIRRQVKDHEESLEYVIKNGDTNAQEELNTCISSIKNKEVDLKRELTDDEVMDVIRRQVKESLKDKR